jgi:hypothetical protein
MRPGALPVGKTTTTLSDRYRIEALPSGRLALVARCRDTQTEVGLVPFAIDDGPGYVASLGMQRTIAVEIAVDSALCRN